MMLKLLMPGGLLAMAWAQASGILEGVALVGAAVAALGVIHLQVIRPAVKAIRRLFEAVDVMLDMPAVLEELRSRLDDFEERLIAVESVVHTAAENARELRVEGAMDITPLPKAERRREPRRQADRGA